MKRYIRSSALPINKESVVVRRELAADPDTDLKYLSELAKDSDDVVRSRVAQNRSTPLNILMELLADEDTEVATQAALNSNMPEDTYTKYREFFRNRTMRTVAKSKITVDCNNVPSVDELHSWLADTVSKFLKRYSFTMLSDRLEPVGDNRYEYSFTFDFSGHTYSEAFNTVFYLRGVIEPFCWIRGHRTDPMYDPIKL